jgi:type 1 fimbria pilin
MRMLALLILLLAPPVAFSFTCTGFPASNNLTKSNTVPAADVPLTTSGTYTGIPFTTTCTGDINGGMNDALRIQSVYFNPMFSDRGFVLEVSLGNGVWQQAADVIHQCLWPNSSNNCEAQGGPGGEIRSINIRLRRTVSTSFTTIYYGTHIAQIKVEQRSGGVWNTAAGSLSLTLDYNIIGDLNWISRTCDVSNFNALVVLPNVSASALRSSGIGRYTAAWQSFKINLACQNNPTVKVTFTGTGATPTIIGTNEEALTNQVAGNPNVGIQLEHVNSTTNVKTTVKSGTPLQVLQSAGANETLDFNAYYYFNGGAVSGGPVSSNAEFLFNYQ